MRYRALFGLAALAALAVMVFLMRERPLAVETATAMRQALREYVSEEGTTRLATDYVIDMPVAGTLERIPWEIGDAVAQGTVLAQVEPFSLGQQVAGLEAAIAQVRALITGVDVAKPKPEELEGSEIRVQKQQDALALAEKDLRNAEIHFTDADRDYQRVAVLLAQHAISQAQYDDAQQRVQSAGLDRDKARLSVHATEKSLAVAELSARRLHRSVDDNEYQREADLARIQQLEADLNMLRHDLHRTEITAPIAGVILEKYVEGNRVLAPGTPLLKLGDPTAIEIESDILSEEAVKVREDQTVLIEGKALDGATIVGSVKRIYPSGFKKISALGIEQQRVKILIAFDNTAFNLRPGTSVDIKVVTAERPDALTVPERATFRREGEWAVFVVRKGRAVYTQLKVGLRNDDWTEVLEGLREGDTVVADVVNDLRDGQRVIPR